MPQKKSKAPGKRGSTEYNEFYNKKRNRKGELREPKGGSFPGKNAKVKECTPQHLQFVELYVQLGTVAKASEALGIPKSRGSDWVNHPVIKAEIDKHRKRLREKIGYTLATAMEEAEEARQFAKDTKNANAYVKAVELKTKLNGLLIEKHDHRMAANFSIQIEGVRDKPTPVALENHTQQSLPNKVIRDAIVDAATSSTEHEKDEEELLS